MTYKRKLLINFLSLFALFAIVVIYIQYSRERSYKKESLKGTLIAYTNIINNYVMEHRESVDYEVIANLLPSELRITIVDSIGVVQFDDNELGVKITDNHINRPEIVTAKSKGTGVVIRRSASTGIDYYYLATAFNKYYVRVALPYNLNVKALLKGDNLYIYLIIALFIAATLSLLLISDKLGRSISAMRDFAYSLSRGNINKSFIFPSGELGEIGQKLVENYRSLESSRAELKQEKDKLIKHFTHSTAGIAFFSPLMEPIYYNSLFMTHLNSIVETPTLNVSDIFTLQEFGKSLKFIGEQKRGVFEDTIKKNGLYYNLRTIIFDDGSIEVIVNNVSAAEKNRLIKQEMTSNIAHELRTPVSSISGYLETLISCDMPKDKQMHFIERSYLQAQRLAALIRDISIISRIEQGQTDVEKDKINILKIVNDVLEELKEDTVERNVTIVNNIPNDVEINGNSSLVHSIFRNLVDNAQLYAGRNITIKLNMFMQDSSYYYFSVSDNGIGIDEKHLPRIFDRFYRISEGRTRKDGGSGLGLSIVKNSVIFHGGTINAKKSANGGVEVIFTLAK